MITISLDEQGEFEDLYKSKKKDDPVKPVFIAGLVFDDLGNREEYEKEKARIADYLRDVCDGSGGKYPTDLHVNNKGNKNDRKVASVKKRLSHTLPKFFAKERAGKYFIFVNLVCDDSTHKPTKAQSKIYREDYASNLYMHMAEDVVERLIFHNPLIDPVKCVRLALATRTLPIRSGAEGAYEKTGYDKKNTVKDKNANSYKSYYSLTDGGSYRTAIGREMQDTERWDIQFDAVSVKPIKYELPQETEKNTPKFADMEFLYLADVICSVLGFQAEAESAEALLQEIDRRADHYFAQSGKMIFLHDPIDIGFRKAWEKLEERDYYHALRITYDTLHRDSPFTAYYRENWFRLLEERLLCEDSVVDYQVAIERLEHSIRESNLNQDRLFYIFNHLEAMKKQMESGIRNDKSVLYNLYNAGVSAYCHIGQSQKALECFEKCQEYSEYVGIETYVRTANKLSVLLDDSFLFEEACEKAEMNKMLYEQLLPIKAQMTGRESQNQAGYGRVCSQLGQTYAFLRDNRAEDVFLQALEKFGDTDSPDYLITASYLLQFYLDTEKREKYERLVRVYFDDETELDKQLSCIREDAILGRSAKRSMKFALYVFVRGLYTFYREGVRDGKLDSLLADLQNFAAEMFAQAEGEALGHPWEIIYKYLALLFHVHEDEEKADFYLQKLDTAVYNQGVIIDLITWFGKIQYCHQVDTEETRKMKKELLDTPPSSLCEDHPVHAIVHSGEEPEKIYERLSREVFTYMYC